MHTPQHPERHLGEFSRVQTKKDVWWFQPTSDAMGTKIRDDLLPSMGGAYNTYTLEIQNVGHS